MTELLITCGITAYNAEDSIERAIRSALSQTWRPLEIVVVNDCSTDKTSEIMRRLALEHDEIRIIDHGKNRGVAAARNNIVNEAKGTFVAFFDDDDESHPERLARQVNRIKEYEKQFSNGSPVVCYTARKQVYPDGRIVYSSTLGQNANLPAPSGMDMVDLILTGKRPSGTNGTCATCSQMARLETYHAAGLFDPAFRRSEDTDFNVRLALKGGHFVGIAEPLVTQTMTISSEKSLAEERHYILLLLDKYREHIDRTTDYDFCRQWANRKFDLLQEQSLATCLKFTSMMLRYPLLTTQRLWEARKNASYNRSQLRLHKFDKTTS